MINVRRVATETVLAVIAVSFVFGVGWLGWHFHMQIIESAVSERIEATLQEHEERISALEDPSSVYDDGFWIRARDHRNADTIRQDGRIR